MNLAAYTAEAICQSMGLPSFIDKLAGESTLRLLLKPAFDPEICLTICQTADQTRLSSIVLQQSFWQQGGPCAMPTWREEVSIAAELFSQLVAEFNAAHRADQEVEGRMVCLDGISISVCWSQGRDLQKFETHVYRPLVKAFVSNFLTLAWESCRFSRVRNGLAICGNYVGLKLPLLELPRESPFSRIAVLGNSDDRGAYLQKLQSNTSLNREADRDDA